MNPKNSIENFTKVTLNKGNLNVINSKPLSKKFEKSE